MVQRAGFDGGCRCKLVRTAVTKNAEVGSQRVLELEKNFSFHVSRPTWAFPLAYKKAAAFGRGLI